MAQVSWSRCLKKNFVFGKARENDSFIGYQRTTLGNAIPRSLSRVAAVTVADEDNDVLVSAASAWEIATKVRKGKLPEAEVLERDFMVYMDDAGYTMLSVDTTTALRAGRLVGEHRDPFDRMIAAQALALDIPVVSPDQALDGFGIRRIW